MVHMMNTQFRLRLPPELHAMVQSAASANNRTINAQIVHMLSTWREPAASGSPAQIGIAVDSSQVKDALHLVHQLQQAAEQANEACRKLGIKTVGA